MKHRTLTSIVSERDRPMFKRLNSSALSIPLLLLVLVSMVSTAARGRGKNKISYGEGLIVNILCRKAKWSRSCKTSCRMA